MAARLYTHNQKVYILLCVVRVGLLCGRVCSASEYIPQVTYATQEPYTHCRL